MPVMLHVFAKKNEATNESDTQRTAFDTVERDFQLISECTLNFTFLSNQCSMKGFVPSFKFLSDFSVLVDRPRTIAKHASSSS